MSALGGIGKSKHYSVDGTGRDSYVSFNNGGFTAPHEPSKQFQSGGFGPPQNRRASHLDAKLKPINYHGNGTGRDSYIYANSGGFQYEFSKQGAGDHFVDSLRNYSQSMLEKQRRIYQDSSQGISPKKDIFIESQMMQGSGKKRYGQMMSVFSRQQKVQVNRLSAPKIKSPNALREDSGSPKDSSPDLKKNVDAKNIYLRKSIKYTTPWSQRLDLGSGGRNERNHLGKTKTGPVPTPRQANERNAQLSPPVIKGAASINSQLRQELLKNIKGDASRQNAYYGKLDSFAKSQNRQKSSLASTSRMSPTLGRGDKPIDAHFLPMIRISSNGIRNQYGQKD